MLTTLLPIVLLVSHLVSGINFPRDEEKEAFSAVVLNQSILQRQIDLLQNNVEQLKDFSCPYPYVQVLDECFYLSDMKLNWTQARNYCQGMKGDLASPKNLYALKSYILKNIRGKDQVWVGATDEGREGDWKWLDGRPVNMEDFYHNQPDNYKGVEHCSDITTFWHPTLNDLSCVYQKRFVCQYKPTK